MHDAPIGPAVFLAFFLALPPVMRLIPAWRAVAHNATQASGESSPLGMVPGRSGGDGLMRRMLIAAAIAGGLVALWALLVPVVA